jgi:hypothetical protein
MEMKRGEGEGGGGGGGGGGGCISTILPTSPHLKNNSFEKGKKLFPFFFPLNLQILIYNRIHSTYFHYLALYTLNLNPSPSHPNTRFPFTNGKPLPLNLHKWKTSSFKPTQDLISLAYLD